MDHTDIAMIHVITENEAAIGVYSKVGSEVYLTIEIVEL
jgi:ribosomal protein S18 acetylase RimI-like enzyme